MVTLDVGVEDRRWNEVQIEDLAGQAIAETLKALALDPSVCEVSLLACDDDRIATLNGDFRDKTTATNVLSWPAEERGAATAGMRPAAPFPGPDGIIELGDIAISYDTCAAEAAAANKPLSAHATHLIVHGTLHLLGYDHIREADGDLMEALEVEILGKMGLDDPYS